MMVAIRGRPAPLSRFLVRKRHSFRVFSSSWLTAPPCFSTSQARDRDNRAYACDGARRRGTAHSHGMRAGDGLRGGTRAKASSACRASAASFDGPLRLSSSRRRARQSGTHNVRCDVGSSVRALSIEPLR